MEERKYGGACRRPEGLEPRNRVTFQLKMLDRMIRRYIDRRVTGTGVYRSQHQLLMYLSRETDCSQTTLAERLEISPAAVAVSLKKLEQGGFVRRQNRKDDNRCNRVELTEKGQGVVNTSIAIFRQLDRDLCRDFTEEEMQQLESLLLRIRVNLEEADREASLPG